MVAHKTGSYPSSFGTPGHNHPFPESGPLCIPTDIFIFHRPALLLARERVFFQPVARDFSQRGISGGRAVESRFETYEKGGSAS